MTRLAERRHFLKTSAALGAGVWLGASRSARAESPADKLNLAVIGIGGQGRVNLNAVASQNIVALCDVDDQRAGDAFEKFPKAKKYVDFRKLLDEHGIENRREW